mgnify:CR=1 FL=1
MGKLLEKYTKPEQVVEFKFPLSNDKLRFRRPTLGDIQVITEFGQTVGDKDDMAMLAKMLKVLCLDFAEESETLLKKDLEQLEAPDRGALLPFYFELLGINRDELMEQVNRNLTTTTKN